MKVCVEAHVSPLFGVVPVGSLWEDDSPFVLADFAHCFAPVEVEVTPPEKPAPRAVRKFGEKPAPAPAPETTED